MAYKVGDFSFNDKEEAKVAQKELQAVTYIRQNMDFSSPEKVLQIYLQIQEKALFHTVVGNSFLEELRNYLADKQLLEEEPSRENPKREKRRNAVLEKYKKRCKLLTFLCITMLVIIVGMFVVAGTSNSPNILNYEEKIQDKYAGWEQDLTEREKELKKSQEKLTERENALKKAEENSTP